MTPRTRRAISLAVLLVGFTTLAGCSSPPPEEPPILLPPVAWEDGIAPSSPLESDPIVQAARTATAADAYSWNSGNFDFAQLNQSWQTDDIEWNYRGYIQQTGPRFSFIFPGPPAWTPLSIDANPNGDSPTWIILRICGNSADWIAREDKPTTTGLFDRATATTGFISITDNEDGTYTVVDRDYGSGGPEGAFGSGEPCDGSTIPVGRYRITPPFPRLPVTKAQKPPRYLDTAD
ncbi:hypothetical protein SAMN06295974_3134 [Plantibacter flavus]|uniref:Lipoprotein n=1 Tax=Plantibacter flavus TaxID=150123 RepID=A0A3N2C3Z6_9MICO|nr:hypothetical protein [Plantibacter flavus]ROR82241.1 hypothetical protein EDD42_2329 [Plantibacter flavus]SMG42612.1 hypothetical protein SAMN06295974_3134 [Plantibacter flavus]